MRNRIEKNKSIKGTNRSLITVASAAVGIGALIAVGAVLTPANAADGPAIVGQTSHSSNGIKYYDTQFQGGGHVVNPSEASISAAIKAQKAKDAAQDAAIKAKAAGGVKGDKGDPGTPGNPGDNGKDAVVGVQSIDGNRTLTNIGGSWTSGHVTPAGATLKAGTYLVTLTGDFYRTTPSVNGVTPEFQIQLNGASRQVTAYTGAFPNDASGVGVDANGAPNGREQTATVTAIITVAHDGTPVTLDAFGYNPNTSADGGGAFAVNAHADIVQLNVQQ